MVLCDNQALWLGYYAQLPCNNVSHYFGYSNQQICFVFQTGEQFGFSMDTADLNQDGYVVWALVPTCGS